jgi:hypothetical protein
MAKKISSHNLILCLAWLALAVMTVQSQTGQVERREIQGRLTLPVVHFPAGKSFVEVPFEVDSNLMIIPVSVNNSRPLRFALDTGAQGAVLFNSAAIDVSKLNIVGKVRMRGAGSGPNTEAQMSNNVTFNISGVELSGSEMVVTPPGTGLPARGHDGAIGRTVFAGLVVEVDWEKHLIKLYDPAKYKYSGKGAVLPLTFDEGGRPYTMAVAVMAGDKAVPVKLVVDSGASTALSLDVGSHPDIKPPEGAVKTVLGRGASGEFTGYAGHIKSLQLGSYEVKDVATDFPDESQGTSGLGGRQGRLGAGVLRRFKIIYDYSRKQIIFEPNKFLNDSFVVPRGEAVAIGVKLTPTELQRYVGQYGNKEISIQGGELFYQRIGGRGATLRALSKDTFALNEDAKITFVRDAQGNVTEMLIEWRDRDKERLSRAPL